MTDPPAERAERTVPEEYAAHLERALLQAQALIESSMSLCRRQPVTALTAGSADKAVLDSALCHLVGGVRHTLSVALTQAGDFTNIVLRLLAGIDPSVMVRVLSSAELADAPLAVLRGLPHARLEIRVIERELREIVVVDGAGALVGGAPTEHVSRATVVNDIAVIRALELLFAGAWSRGRRLTDHLDLGPRLRTTLARSILERMRCGHTDDVAARELNVSLRTYRRHVAEIMRELDANSRFQAGARAVELGLLAV
ncbi:DNA-binding response regulator [Streptomyces sp. NPDC058382]|uniref:helix-turn-helix transcriptional regulator n=1 Tax=unclassified Streptomyces TaxID=2593676 RepID=UPI0036323AA8